MRPQSFFLPEARHSIGCAALVLVALFPRAAAATPLAESPGGQCLAAIAAAEQRMRLPARLLRSIALVESGRPDPVTRRALPWPWTINAAGTGHVFPSREQAVAAVQSFQSRGIQSIDVGCAQVNLLHHPDAFTSLDAAFDPQINADYAARFLVALHAVTRNWPSATAAYHSRTPERGLVYAQKVRAVWPDANRHGPWPGPYHDRSAPSADYSIYTPEFAARLRRMDQDRTHTPSSLSVYTPEFAARLRQMGPPEGRRSGAIRRAAAPGRTLRSASLLPRTQMAQRGPR